MDRLGLGQEMSKMNLEPLVVAESKKVLQKENSNDGYILKGHRSQPKELTMAKTNNFSNKMNKVVLDYSPKYELNVHESKLTNK